VGVDDFRIDVRWKAMRERSDSFTDAPIEPGTLVRYDGLTDGGPEFGVVVSCWLHPQVKFYDCYVAFFGAEVPKGEPEMKPYVLRYASVSLARLELAENVS
jgi:hypothetical protein